MKIFQLSAVSFGILLFFSTWIHSQEIADSLWLGEIRIKASRVDIQDKYQAVSSFRVDSSKLATVKATSLADAIQFFTPLFIRNNGPGGLSTVNSRGFSSSQTQVVWNGFQLNHSMLGVTDLSIIPITTISEILTSSGTGNTSFGDRGGGTIAIQTKDVKNDVGVIYQFGSFGEQQYSVEAGVALSNWDIGVLAGFQSADNDFEYSTLEFSNEVGGFVDVTKKRQFNQNESATVLLSIGAEFNAHELNSKLWVLDSENQIPGGVSSLNDAAVQNDAFIRWLTNWRFLSGKNRFEGSLYIASQELDYIDQNASISSLSDIRATSADFTFKRSINNQFQIISGLRATRNSVKTTEYPSDVTRDELFLNINSIWSPTGFLYVYPAFSVALNSDYGFNYTGDIGLNTEVINDQLFLKVNGSRNFIAPTFNDLYWPGLGDSELEPETVIKFESSILHVVQNQNLKVESKALVYKASVDNGIRWLPNSRGESSPQNIESLSMSGFELSNQTDLRVENWRFSGGVILSQVLASISEERFENDGALDKQLIYTPEWQYKMNLSVGYKNLSTTVFYSFVDDRFTSSDHSSPFDPLASYKTIDWVTSLDINHQLASHSIQFIIRNVLDEEYSIIRDYPMPGTHYKISFKTNF